jgi:hypothetical protein
MKVFSSDSRGVEAWGPTAAVDVNVDALGGVVDNSWILVNFAVGAREIVDVRQCFDDMSFIYALGNNQSNCQISLTFAILIGTKFCKGSNNTAAIEEGISAYVSNRISQRINAGKISIGNFSRMGWLTGIDIGNADVNKGVCYGTVHFLMELKK